MWWLKAKRLEYELANIETVVNKLLGMTNPTTFRDEDTQHIKDFFSSEYNRIITAFRKTVLLGKSERYVRVYFTIHQAGLVEILDKLFLMPSKISKHDSALLDVVNYLHTAQRNLLSAIENQFSNYFNYDVNAPQYLFNEVKQHLTSKMDTLSTIRTKAYVEEELIAPVMSALQESIRQNVDVLTFKQLYYLKLLLDEICQIDFSIDDADWRRMNLCNVLIKSNFNETQFFKFYTGHITKALLTCETLADRIDQAAYFFKIVSQVSVTPGVAFNGSAMSVKEQLLEWISSELEYLHQKKQLQLSTNETGQIKNDFKIIFDLSVSQLGYLFKLLMDTGLIQNKNTSEVIRFLAKFVKTKKAETVSYESLRIKFYNTETGTKDAVRKIFQSLLSYINKN